MTFVARAGERLSRCSMIRRNASTRSGIELAAALLLDLGDRLVDGPRFLVGTLLGQRVEDVRDRDDAAGERDGVARDARRSRRRPSARGG